MIVQFALRGFALIQLVIVHSSADLSAFFRESELGSYEDGSNGEHHMMHGGQHGPAGQHGSQGQHGGQGQNGGQGSQDLGQYGDQFGDSSNSIDTGDSLGQYGGDDPTSQYGNQAGNNRGNTGSNNRRPGGNPGSGVGQPKRPSGPGGKTSNGGGSRSGGQSTAGGGRGGAGKTGTGGDKDAMNIPKGGIDFSNCEEDEETGLCCVIKEETIETVEKEPLLECTHTQIEKCHYTYVTQFVPSKEESCDENFEKSCSITFTKTAMNETVQKCYTPLVRVCDDERKPGDKPMNDNDGDIPEYNEIPDSYIPANNRFKRQQEEQPFCRTFFETSCTTRYVEKMPGKFVGETSCEKIPVELCETGNCRMEPGEEECHDKAITSIMEVPQESCDLNPMKICAFVTKLVPRLEPVHECALVPQEVCQLKFMPAKVIEKPLLTKWCLDPSDPESVGEEPYGDESDGSDDAGRNGGNSGNGRGSSSGNGRGGNSGATGNTHGGNNNAGGRGGNRGPAASHGGNNNGHAGGRGGNAGAARGGNGGNNGNAGNRGGNRGNNGNRGPIQQAFSPPEDYGVIGQENQVVPVIDSYLTPSIESPPSGDYLSPGQSGPNSGFTPGASREPLADTYSGPLPGSGPSAAGSGFNFGGNQQQPIDDSYSGPGGDNFADFSNQSPNFVRPPTHSNRGQQGQAQTQHPQPRGGNGQRQFNQRNNNNNNNRRPAGNSYSVKDNEIDTTGRGGQAPRGQQSAAAAGNGYSGPSNDPLVASGEGYAAPLPVNGQSQQNRPFGVSSSAVGDSYGGPPDYDYSYDSYDDEYNNAAPNDDNYGAPQGTSGNGIDGDYSAPTGSGNVQAVNGNYGGPTGSGNVQAVNGNYGGPTGSGNVESVNGNYGGPTGSGAQGPEEEYGSPSNNDYQVNEIDDGYGGPGSEVDTEYGAPTGLEDNYGAPSNDYSTTDSFSGVGSALNEVDGDYAAPIAVTDGYSVGENDGQQATSSSFDPGYVAPGTQPRGRPANRHQQGQGSNVRENGESVRPSASYSLNGKDIRAVNEDDYYQMLQDKMIYKWGEKLRLPRRLRRLMKAQGYLPTQTV